MDIFKQFFFWDFSFDVLRHEPSVKWHLCLYPYLCVSKYIKKKYCEFVCRSSGTVTAHWNSPMRLKLYLVPYLGPKNQVLELTLARDNEQCLVSNIYMLGLSNKRFSEWDRTFPKLSLFSSAQIQFLLLPLLCVPYNFAYLNRSMV